MTTYSGTNSYGGYDIGGESVYGFPCWYESFELSINSGQTSITFDTVNLYNGMNSANEYSWWGPLTLDWGSSSDFIGTFSCDAITPNIDVNAYDFQLLDGQYPFRNDPYGTGAYIQEYVYTYSDPVCDPAMQVAPLVNLVK